MPADPLRAIPAPVPITATRRRRRLPRLRWSRLLFALMIAGSLTCLISFELIEIWPDQVVARFRGGIISEEELLGHLMHESLAGGGESPGQDVKPADLLPLYTPEEIESSLARLAARKALYESPEGRALQKDPDTLFNARIDTIHVLAEQMRDWLKQQVPSLSARDIEEYLIARREEFERPETFTIRQLFININLYEPPIPRRSLDEAKALALDLRRRLSEGEDFISLIEQYSDSPSKERQGLVGPYQSNQVLKALDQGVRSLQVGEIGAPLLQEEGCHLIQLVDHQKAGLPSIAEASPAIAPKLIEERYNNHLRSALRAIESQTQGLFVSLTVAAESPDRSVLYRIGDFSLSLSELRKWYEQLPSPTREEYSKPEGGPDYLALREQARAWYEDALLARMAQIQNLPQAPLFDQQLEKNRFYRVTDQLLEDRVGLILDEEADQGERIRAYYDKNNFRFRSPSQVLLESCQIPIPATYSLDRRSLYRLEVAARKRAELVLSRIQSGSAMPEAAKDISAAIIHPATWIVLSNLEEELQEHLSVLDASQITRLCPITLPVLQEGDTFSVARILAYVEGEIPALETILPEIKAAYRSERYPAIEYKVVEQINRDTFLRIRLDHLKALDWRLQTKGDNIHENNHLDIYNRNTEFHRRVRPGGEQSG